MSDAVLLPDRYGAGRMPSLTLRVRTGAAPVYITGSPKLTEMAICRPWAYGPSGVADVTPATRGPAVSMAMSLECASEPRAPGSGSVRFAGFPTASAMAPFRASVP